MQLCTPGPNHLTHFDLYGLLDYVNEENETCGYLFAEKFATHLTTVLGRDAWNAVKEIVDFASHPIDKSHEYWNVTEDICREVGSLNQEKISQIKDLAIEKFNEDPSRALAEAASYLLPGGGVSKVGKGIQASRVAQDLAKAGTSLVDKVAQKVLTGNKISKVARQKKRAPLPKDPSKLLEQGYHEISHPDGIKNGHRAFRNSETNDIIKFDLGEEGALGHRGADHYHRLNPNKTNKRDYYLDKNGNPCAKGSEASHLYPGD